MKRATRFSYLFLVAVFVLAAVIHLATPLITVLFSYFALRKLYFGKRKWLSLLLFFVVVAATLYGAISPYAPVNAGRHRVRRPHGGGVGRSSGRDLGVGGSRLVP